MRVGYCRVSTTSGEQLSALEGQVARVEAVGVDRVITDVESGRNTDRPGLVELLELIDTRQVSEVVATRVDRLGRDANATDALIVLAQALADPAAWEAATAEELRAVFLELVERIDADRGQVAAVLLRL